MDWKQFVSTMTGNLAWPISIVVLMIVFRREVLGIIERITHLKYKDLELDFDKVKAQAEALERELPTSKAETIPVNPALDSLEDQMLDAVERAPAAAILLAWSGLEAAIASAVNRLAISAEPPSYRSPLHNIEALDNGKRLSKNHKLLLMEMRHLRNTVAHNREAISKISRTQALNYVNTAIKLIKHFEGYNAVP